MKNVLSHVIGWAIASLMWVGLYLHGQNQFVDNLVAVGAWLVVAIAWLVAILLVGGGAVLNITSNKQVLQNSDPDKYKCRWWSTLLTIMWVVMFAYAGWITAAALYALATIISWIGMACIRYAVLEAQKPRSA